MKKEKQAIEVQDISMRFQLMDDRILSLKEFATRKLRGKVSHTDFWALKHISFEDLRGDEVGIIGHNGTRKSTLLKVITGIFKQT